MIYLGLLLHLYQPWWQSRKMVQKITTECYRPLINILNSHGKKVVTLNVQWSLIEKLEKYGENDVVEGIKKAVATEKVELVSTAAYHPILPLISSEMMGNQIKCDQDMKKTRGIIANSSGFFLPEMAYDKNVIPILKNFGVNWTLTDDISFNVEHRYVPFNKVSSQDGIAVFLRSNFWSNLIAMNKINWQEFEHHFPSEVRRWTNNQDCYVILAMDGETFGHHHKTLTSSFLEPLLVNFSSGEDVSLAPIGEILSKFPKFKERVPSGSWATSPDDFRKGDYFPLWRSPQNPVHELMWKISKLAVSCLNRNIEHDLEVLKCQTSCQFWWLAGGRWRPDVSMKDINHSISVILKRGDDAQKAMARQYREELLKQLGKENKN